MYTICHYFDHHFIIVNIHSDHHSNLWLTSTTTSITVATLFSIRTIHNFETTFVNYIFHLLLIVVAWLKIVNILKLTIVTRFSYRDTIFHPRCFGCKCFVQSIYWKENRHTILTDTTRFSVKNVVLYCVRDLSWHSSANRDTILSVFGY